uniref:Uncharacterized protein n=1 Tax=Amphimedon queenslandica TaxID=400682 RepID=A0A1X7SL21_AMPQE
MFEKHLLKQLQSIIEPPSSLAQSLKPPAGGFSLVPSLMPSAMFAKKEASDKMYKGIPMLTFKSALEGVKDLLLKIVEGTATYSDITAEGAIKLETINTEKEFSTLRTFSETIEMNRDNLNGLDGVRSMLELFQFTYHIQTIDAVFEQYGLENCRSDPTLKKLLKIMEELRPEGSRAKLTPLEAMEKMSFIKKSLCLQNATSYECLNLFPAVANSAAFYQFIRDKQFVGQRGNALFHEQYQLITAQLQHEEYDENVLNHLRVAFECLSPFMESDVSFNELMSRVSRLDATHGLKQLETVNENITLIRLWFSRAEGDTIENVANELDNIISTGLYQFFLSGHHSSPQIYLLYKTQQKISQTQALRSQNRLAPPQTQLEDSDKLSDSEIDKLGGADFTTLPTVFPSPQPQTFGGNPL